MNDATETRVSGFIFISELFVVVVINRIVVITNYSSLGGFFTMMLNMASLKVLPANYNVLRNKFHSLPLRH